MHIHAKKGGSGFCGMNSGEINYSFCENQYQMKEKFIGFCKNTKGIKDCFFVLEENIKKEAALDKTYAIPKLEIMQKLADKENWNLNDGNFSFNPKKYEEIPNEEEMHITIHTEAEFLEYAKNVNEGLDEYACATVRLENNLDFKGKKISPIGKGELTPFRGIFNGNGFQIQNFIIQEKKGETSGLFGYVKNGIIENLSVDGIVHGGKYAGAIAGINDNGKILGCQAAVKGDAQYCFGGVAGKNSGLIENCMCTGRADYKNNTALLIGGSTAMILAAAAAAIFLWKSNENGRVRYPAIPVSEDAVPIEGDKDKPEKGENSILYQMETKINADTGEGQADIHFKNPGKSNHNIVVELQISDAELKHTIGKTGRSKEEQKELEQEETYDAKTSRVILAQSGAILPGYELKQLKLKPLADGTVLPKGTYQAVVYLILYNMETNEKAMVNAQTPVTLVIGG